ncbi:MAG: hypothetical protein J7647_06860 [Cyanobacteria bacterium SBLK]|nr:hypothetical protein [Cyanobacteria bacterium SBLK]
MLSRSEQLREHIAKERDRPYFVDRWKARSPDKKIAKYDLFKDSIRLQRSY